MRMQVTDFKNQLQDAGKHLAAVNERLRQVDEKSARIGLELKRFNAEKSESLPRLSAVNLRNLDCY